MTTTNSIARLRNSVGQSFNWQYFLQDNLTGSRLQTIWVVILTLATVLYAIGQLNTAPLMTIIILAVWALGVASVIANALFNKVNPVSNWLKINLFSSVSNTLITLLLVLAIAAAARGIYSYAFLNANFNPDETTPEFQIEGGATWGVLIGAKDLLLYGRLDRVFVPRVNMAAGLVALLSLLSFIVNKIGLLDGNKPVRQTLTFLWLLSPFILFMMLAGVKYEVGSSLINMTTLLQGLVILLLLYGLFVWQRVVKFSPISLFATAAIWPAAYAIWRVIGRSGVFPVVNVDTWGGIMLTMIIAVSVILLSFPIGMVFALGRRSEVRGVPWWIVWPVAIITALLGFRTTPDLIANSRNTFETLVAFWPLIIPLTAYALMRVFKGNVVAAATTTFIEVVRGVPLITLLFMGIIMAPFFFQDGVTIKNTYSVIAGYTIFASAYMAELIRGGLQAIPAGQFEAADAIGLNTLQKMRFIILPQALRILVPALVGSFIGNFKSSSLVSIVGLFDLVGIAAAVTANPLWLGLKPELYYAMAVFYFLVSYAMSSYSRGLETKLAVGER